MLCLGGWLHLTDVYRLKPLRAFLDVKRYLIALAEGFVPPRATADS